MVSNISSCTKVLVLPIVLWVVSSFSLRAQEKDFATWANAGFEYKLKPAFTVSGGLEWRTKDDLGKTDRWGLKVGPGVAFQVLFVSATRVGAVRGVKL